MDDSIELGIKNIHTKFRFIWIAVCTGVIAIISISYILFHYQIIELTPAVDPEKSNKIVLVIVVAIFMALFFIKRSYLVVSKIKEKSRKYIGKTNSSDFAFLSPQNEKHSLYAAAVIYVNKLYLFTWFLADLVVIIAFVNFILAPLLNTFLIYCFVGVYSLIVNYPSIKIYKKLFNYLND